MSAPTGSRPCPGSPTSSLPPARDDGMSVAELLVVMGLLGLLTTILSATAILGIKSVDGVENRLDNARSSEIAMESVSKVLRTAVLPGQLDRTCDGCTANAVVSASGTKLSFYANLENAGEGPKRVTLEVVEDSTQLGTGVLVMTQQAPTVAANGSFSYCNPAAPTCTVGRREVARGLVWPSTQVFTYIDFAGVTIPGTTVAATQLPQIASVDVHVEVRTRLGTRYTTAVAWQRVRLPNAEINAREDLT